MKKQESYKHGKSNQANQNNPNTKPVKTITCKECHGSGFSGYGTGYDAMCDNCAGHGEHPYYTPTPKQASK